LYNIDYHVTYAEVVPKQLPRKLKRQAGVTYRY